MAIELKYDPLAKIIIIMHIFMLLRELMVWQVLE